MTNKVIIVMGVSGCGKSTIGKLLAQELQIPFFDGDDFHPEANIEKMANGIPLNDADRYDWLVTLNNIAKTQLDKSSCVIVCSALKKSYREILKSGLETHSVKWIHLTGTFDQIFKRLNKRENHFMPSNLLQSQFDTLEKPENALEIDISLAPNTIIKYITKTMGIKSEFGLFGLGVMGKSLSRNLAQKGFNISIFNREVKGSEENVAINFKNSYKELDTAQAFSDIEAFVHSLQTPRRIMLMVNAGKITDVVIENLIPFLSEGDVLIDGGNSNYLKTKERYDYLKSKNIHFIGAGVSGGEEGALKGPSIMPGGNKDSYNLVKPYLEAIAAKDNNNLPCCTYIGDEGSGHFVKMVHNGIEYVEMQLLAEIYTIFGAQGKNPDEIATILESWKTESDSYLLGITVDILRKKEGDDWLINKIMDKAGNKGTGNWTTITTAQLGMPSTMIASALFARYTSFFKDDRTAASQYFKSEKIEDLTFDNNEVLKAYQFARLVNHYQGFKLIHAASMHYNWGLNLSELARVWTNGCIIKSDLMIDLVEIFKSTNNLLESDEVVKQLNKLKPSIKKIVSKCVLNDLSIPNLIESISFLNSFAVSKSSANIIQAQRDYFGAHTYQRIDDNTEKFYHTNW